MSWASTIPTHLLCAGGIAILGTYIKISDLRDHPNLKVGLTHEFLERKDGWEPLSRHYGLQIKPRGMEHALAYAALNKGEIDLMDAYSTDAKLVEYDLAVLEDDLHFFSKVQRRVSLPVERRSGSHRRYSYAGRCY